MVDTAGAPLARAEGGAGRDEGERGRQREPDDGTGDRCDPETSRVRLVIGAMRSAHCWPRRRDLGLESGFAPRARQ